MIFIDVQLNYNNNHEHCEMKSTQQKQMNLQEKQKVTY